MHVCTMADSVGTSPAGASQLEDQKTCKLHHTCFQHEHHPPIEKADLQGVETCRLPSLLFGVHLYPEGTAGGALRSS